MKQIEKICMEKENKSRKWQKGKWSIDRTPIELARVSFSARFQMQLAT